MSEVWCWGKKKMKKNGGKWGSRPLLGMGKEREMRKKRKKIEGSKSVDDHLVEKKKMEKMGG